MDTNLTRRQLLRLAAATLGTAAAPVAAQPPRALQVYKDPTCGCCALWVTHMRKHGFTATVTDVEDMTAIKAKLKVPATVRSCHTASVDGYVLEGHVPAEDVARLLRDRPKVVGIGVAGMPIGSPGMEVTGAKPQAFDVIAFDSSGKTPRFASHNQSTTWN